MSATAVYSQCSGALQTQTEKAVPPATASGACRRLPSSHPCFCSASTSTEQSGPVKPSWQPHRPSSPQVPWPLQLLMQWGEVRAETV